MRNFHIRAGDPFYTPSVDGRPCADGLIEVPPGFDQEAEGLFIPWEAMTSCGLESSEEETKEVVRCIVGPVDPPPTISKSEVDASDWLQMRGETWEPLAQGRWMQLGHRHIMGLIGGAVDMQLTLRDSRLQATDGPASLVELLHFEHAVRCAPSNTVFLNVFDLASALSIPNAVMCNTVCTSLGAFHAAVEVYNEEWSFYRTPNPSSCGVCKSLRPRQHPVHMYRQSLNLGKTALKDWEVRYLIRGKLASKWPGGKYELLNRNCIHFCDELLLSLGVRSVPTWVKNLHEAGSRWLRVPWPLSIFFGEGTAQAPPALPSDERSNRGSTTFSVGEDDANTQHETVSIASDTPTDSTAAGVVPVKPLSVYRR